MLSNLRLALICCLTLFATRLFGRETETNFIARLAPFPPCPALVATAKTNQIPLEQIDPPKPDGTVNPGDSITALVTHFEKGGRRTQWLLYLQAVTPDAKEQAAKPRPPMVMYSSTGSKLEFASSPAWVSLRTLGPFAEQGTKRKPPKVQDKSTRFSLDEGFLSLGFDRAAAVIARARRTTPKGAFAFRDTPFTDAEVRESRKQVEAAQMHLTLEDERALAGTAPALLSYFGIVQRTSGLDDILFKLVDMPSLWSLLRQGGVKTNFRMRSELISRADAAPWGLPDTTVVYYFPLVLELNNQPALNITLVATPPQPPLLACAGIVGMVAERPGKNEDYLTLRIISARGSESNRN